MILTDEYSLLKGRCNRQQALINKLVEALENMDAFYPLRPNDMICVAVKNEAKQVIKDAKEMK